MTKKEFLHRRQMLLSQMAPSSGALFFAAPVIMRNKDNAYPYRQNSDFLYFTGFNEPEAALLLIKSKTYQNYSILFNRRSTLQTQTWLGPCLGQDAAPSQLAVDYSFPWDTINNNICYFLNGLNIIYHAKGQDNVSDAIVLGILNTLKNGSLQNFSAPSIVADWRPWVHELRLIKSKAEQDLLRAAGRISALGHQRAMACLSPEMYEYQLEGEIQYEFNRNGARFTSYNTIIGSGKNACILHYNNNEKKIKSGELVLIDAGCELQGYAGDITRTIPVNGIFSAPQRAIYSIVLDAINLGLSLYKPGTTIFQVTKKVTQMITRRLMQLNILRGNLETLIEENAVHQFFMHKLSHWLGLDVHDVGSYGENYNRVLEPGMVLTVEPGIYIAPDAHAPKEYLGIGIRIEDDILITKDGNENLTILAEKDITKIENLMMNKKKL
ncbi:Xaa-Pro aminopeptidase [Candidatus Erwinia haradaeae]|uniref:Xaa-Pro aminopeptidase n=1 Tax=Candidatus Erwinia haradaeae TaxID=1922217 RepID=A0A451D4Z4_9GAMM|nr:Xaa-Pro aminopeptidase [Candidatus Erwinia haradaeae]VFP80750.1 Xaa-Pro aminopeptidase [Candidatus Erwinia haradaeae]